MPRSLLRGSLLILESRQAPYPATSSTAPWRTGLKTARRFQHGSGRPSMNWRPVFSMGPLRFRRRITGMRWKRYGCSTSLRYPRERSEPLDRRSVRVVSSDRTSAGVHTLLLRAWHGLPRIGSAFSPGHARCPTPLHPGAIADSA